MPVPDYQSLMLPALEALSGSVEVPLSKVRNHGHRCDPGRCPVSRNGALGDRRLAEMGASGG